MDDDSSGSSESLDEASESDFTKDDSTEQKLSGALEPITSQSLASIVDIEDGYE